MIMTPNLIRPTPPADISDAVQLWARQQARRFGRLEWNDMLNAWVIHFGRRESDPMMREWQEGRLEQEPTESVILHEWDLATKRFTPFMLGEYGAEGIVRLLDEANMWSGRGHCDSIQEAVAAVRAHNTRTRERHHKEAREYGSDRWTDRRRAVLNIPFLPVGIDLRANQGSDL